MAIDNLPFFEAKALVQKGERINSPTETNGTPALSLKNFPQLPSKKGVSLVNTPASQLPQKEKSFAACLRYCEPEIFGRIMEILQKATLVKDVEVLLSRLEYAMQLHERTVKED